ncbi:23136_t:CDS:2 [Dentiscutata erythropus]|uniref:23136_t:CDS:1 n=1 Tax=Dentiscutata erythropus TaxID=1348616 RepID=A0A9N9GX14_9GLOM|nr:23136_t:CDS:2 [Dentiscutata erythropus]
MVRLTIEAVIKLVLTQICTQMDLNLNERETEDIIRHILSDLSIEERDFFNNLTTELNSRQRRDDYKIESVIFDGCDFTVGFKTKVKDYIARQSRERNGDDPFNNVFDISDCKLRQIMPNLIIPKMSSHKFFDEDDSFLLSNKSDSGVTSPNKARII